MKKALCVLGILIILFVIYKIEINGPSHPERLEQWLDGSMESKINVFDKYPKERDCINLSLFAFSWSHAYVFKPGTTKKEIEEIIGFKDKNIPKVVKEGYTQLLFVESNTVLCNVHDEKPYVFYFEEFTEPYIKLDDKDQPMFVMERKEEKIVFTYAGNYVEEGSDMPSENGLACKYSNSPVTLQEVIIDE